MFRYRSNRKWTSSRYITWLAAMREEIYVRSPAFSTHGHPRDAPVDYKRLQIHVLGEVHREQCAPSKRPAELSLCLISQALDSKQPCADGFPVKGASEGP